MQVLAMSFILIPESVTKNTIACTAKLYTYIPPIT